MEPKDWDALRLDLICRGFSVRNCRYTNREKKAFLAKKETLFINIVNYPRKRNKGGYVEVFVYQELLSNVLLHEYYRSIKSLFKMLDAYTDSYKKTGTIGVPFNGFM